MHNWPVLLHVGSMGLKKLCRLRFMSPSYLENDFIGFPMEQGLKTQNNDDF